MPEVRKIIKLPDGKPERNKFVVALLISLVIYTNASLKADRAFLKNRNKTL